MITVVGDDVKLMEKISKWPEVQKMQNKQFLWRPDPMAGLPMTYEHAQRQAKDYRRAVKSSRRAWKKRRRIPKKSIARKRLSKSTVRWRY